MKTSESKPAQPMAVRSFSDIPIALELVPWAQLVEMLAVRSEELRQQIASRRAHLGAEAVAGARIMSLSGHVGRLESCEDERGAVDRLLEEARLIGSRYPDPVPNKERITELFLRVLQLMFDGAVLFHGDQKSRFLGRALIELAAECARRAAQEAARG